VRSLTFRIPFPRGSRPFRPQAGALPGGLRLLLLVSPNSRAFTALEACARDWVLDFPVRAMGAEVGYWRDGHAFLFWERVTGETAEG
jgi:hypothetical protein